MFILSDFSSSYFDDYGTRFIHHSSVWQWFDGYDFGYSCMPVLLSSSPSFSFSAFHSLSLSPFQCLFPLYSKYRWCINFGSPFQTFSLYHSFLLVLKYIQFYWFRTSGSNSNISTNDQNDVGTKKANRKCLCVWKMMLDVELSMFLLWRCDCQW